MIIIKYLNVSNNEAIEVVTKKLEKKGGGEPPPLDSRCFQLFGGPEQYLKFLHIPSYPNLLRRLRRIVYSVRCLHYRLRNEKS